MQGQLLNAVQGAFHAVGETVGRGGGSPARRPGGPSGGFPYSAALDGGNFHHLTAQGLTELFCVQSVTIPADNIHHVDRRYYRDAQLQELRGQVQVPLQISTIDDVQNDVGPLLYQIVPGRHLLRGIGGQGVDAGQIGDGYILPALQYALLLLYGDAGPVAHVLIGARQGVEQSGLAGVGVARQGNGDAHGVSLLSYHIISSAMN